MNLAVKNHFNSTVIAVVVTIVNREKTEFHVLLYLKTHQGPTIPSPSFESTIPGIIPGFILACGWEERPIKQHY